MGGWWRERRRHRMSRRRSAERKRCSRSRFFLKGVIQAVLLFGSETWILNPCMERALGSLQHRVAQQINGRKPRMREEGGWEYPPLTSAMEEAGFEEIRVYIKNRQNTVAKYISTRKILYLCDQSVRRPGAWVSWRWWEKEGIKLWGVRERATAASDE